MARGADDEQLAVGGDAMLQRCVVLLLELQKSASLEILGEGRFVASARVMNRSFDQRLQSLGPALIGGRDHSLPQTLRRPPVTVHRLVEARAARHHRCDREVRLALCGEVAVRASEGDPDLAP